MDQSGPDDVGDINEDEDDDGDDDAPYVPKNNSFRALYNPRDDPENTSMHARMEDEDVFGAGAGTNTGTNDGTQVLMPATQEDSDDDPEERRQNSRVLPVTNRSPMPILTMVHVGSFDDERGCTPVWMGESPHGCFAREGDIYTLGEQAILQHHQQNHPVSGDSRDTPQILGNLRDLGGIPGVSRDRCDFPDDCSINEGNFIRALFYPSYIFQTITPEHIELYCNPANKFLAFVFFNGGNAMHTSYRKTIIDLTAFLHRIGCKPDEIQVNVPFYDHLGVENHQNRSKKPKRGKFGKEKPREKEAVEGISPAGYEKENDSYRGPNTAFIMIESNNIRRRLLRLQTFAVTKLLTFHVVELSIEHRPWVVCLMFTNSPKVTEYIADGIRWAIRKAIRDNKYILDQIAKYSGSPGTAQQRTQSFINTIHVFPANYAATKKGQQCTVWKIYAAPFAKGDSFTQIDRREQKVRMWISKLRLQFESIDIWGEVIECTRCKLLEHQAFACVFQSGKHWNGPKDGIGKLLQEVKGAKGKDSDSDS
ncbi:hypothetical protein C8R42DRAFT_640021 [Lentinula raphanica]|nr:hypothetical protein C8R42DRAFT_640021 [Lentinula raphanica]